MGDFREHADGAWRRRQRVGTPSAPDCFTGVSLPDTQSF